MSEFFWSILKHEFYYRHTFISRKLAMKVTAKWIEETCNRTRRHSGIGYETPVGFERKIADSPQAEATAAQTHCPLLADNPSLSQPLVILEKKQTRSQLLSMGTNMSDFWGQIIAAAVGALIAGGFALLQAHRGKWEKNTLQDDSDTQTMVNSPHGTQTIDKSKNYHSETHVTNTIVYATADKSDDDTFAELVLMVLAAIIALIVAILFWQWLLGLTIGFALATLTNVIIQAHRNYQINGKWTAENLETTAFVVVGIIMCATIWILTFTPSSDSASIQAAQQQLNNAVSSSDDIFTRPGNYWSAFREIPTHSKWVLGSKVVALVFGTLLLWFSFIETTSLRVTNRAARHSPVNQAAINQTNSIQDKRWTRWLALTAVFIFALAFFLGAVPLADLISRQGATT